MCNPVLFMIAGGILTAGGAISQGRAAEAAGKANARVQNIMAADARDRGAADEASKRRETAALSGKQAAMFGASGGEINTGSSLEILADTAQFGELDALRIRSNAEREAFAHESAAAIYLAEGKNAKTSSYMSAAGSLLGTAGKVSSKWNVFKTDNPGSSFGDFLKG